MREMVVKLKPSILILLETRVQYRRVNNFWEKLGFHPIAIEEARGFAGGIWILVKDNTISCSILESSSQTVTLSFGNGNSEWLCTAVYASPIPNIRASLWTHLIAIRNQVCKPWVVLGDFNEIVMASEVKGGAWVSSRAKAFRDCLDHCGLIDMGAMGSFFTWKRCVQGQNPMLKRLDRVVADFPWRLLFPNACVEALPRLHSDHCPLFLRCAGFPRPRGVRSFRFEAAWATHKDYCNVVDHAWSKEKGNVVDGLYRVRDDSIMFNKNVFGNIFRRKRLLEARLTGIQKQIEMGLGPLHNLLRLEKMVQLEYEQTLHQEEIIWFQKSREKWVKLGDRNNSFFHAQTMVRRKRNKVEGLHIAGDIWCTDPHILEREACSFFKKLFITDSLNPSQALVSSTMPSLPDEACRKLLEDVTKDEVWNALKFMKAFKSPGPDGFQPFFFKKFWHIVGDDVWLLIRNAFRTSIFDTRLLETLIVLIPKVEVPDRFTHFRPISLCNVTYKLITKVLVNRLRPYLEKIISPFQSSFLPGRGTTDNVIIA